LVSTRRAGKYINKLGIVSLILLLITFISCSEAGDRFNLVLKTYSNESDTGTITFKNLNNDNVIKKDIRTKEVLEIILNLDENYEIKYRNSTGDIFAFIKKIKPLDYGFNKVYLTLNKNKNFRAMIHTISDTINNGDKYHYLYSNNYIYRAQGDNFKKLSLLKPVTESIDKKFIITDNKVINLDGNFLINESNIAFIDNDKISIVSHNILNLDFLNEKHVKINNNDNYFIVTKKENNNYDCISLIKETGNKINTNQVMDCIDFPVNDNIEILTLNQEFYLWDTNTLYKYTSSKFEEVREYDISGEAFENNNNLYLISDGSIYSMDILSDVHDKLNFTDLEIDTLHISKINNNTNLISPETWITGENYYIFNDDNSSITLEEYPFSNITLKNITNIEIDENQNIFFNDSSFEISNQQFNSIRFYNFSYFQ